MDTPLKKINVLNDRPPNRVTCKFCCSPPRILMRSRLFLMFVFALSVLATGCRANPDHNGRLTSVDVDPDTSRTERAPTRAPLDHRTTATGRVLTLEGTPIPGALVDPSPIDGQEWAGYESLRTTDAGGSYQLPLPAGRWDITVSADGYAPNTIRVVVPATGLVETDVPLRTSLSILRIESK
jgi:hypothetical protein